MNNYPDKEKTPKGKTTKKPSPIKEKLTEKILNDIKKDAEKIMRETGQGKY